VGNAVGEAAVGNEESRSVGEAVGEAVLGENEGEADGDMLGAELGLSLVGESVGEPDGDMLGAELGLSLVGESVGEPVGKFVGEVVGEGDGEAVGKLVVEALGEKDGEVEGGGGGHADPRRVPAVAPDEQTQEARLGVTPAGTSPHKPAFPHRYICVKLTRADISFGMEPVSWLLFRYMYRRLVSAASSLGRLPASRLPSMRI